MTADLPLILLVEDEPKIAALLRDYLEQANFETHWIDNGNEVEDFVRQRTPDLVVLDLMLPGKDGLDVCRGIRKFSDVPIMMITAKVEEIDRLLGLELGADDYVCKPFSPREVVARIKVILRRVGARPKATGSYRGLVVDADRFEARVNDIVLDVTPVEFRLLSLLADKPGRVFSRDQLMGAIYPDGRIVEDRTVDSHVKNLRKKLRQGFADEDVIHSIYGVGYKLE